MSAPAVTGEEERNRELVRRMHAEVMSAADPARVDRYFAADFVGHSMPLDLPADREGVKRFLVELRSGLDDLGVTIHALLADGDLVAVRSTIAGVHRGSLLGIPPTGRRLRIDGIDVVRVRDGLIVEHWGLTDMLAVLRQAGRWAGLRGLLRHLRPPGRRD